MTYDTSYPVTMAHVRRGIMATTIMALSVYVSGGGHNTEFVRGILAHGQAQAMLYGLDWPGIVTECKAGLGADVGGLLDAALASAAVEVV